MTQCIFCKIAEGKINSETMYEDPAVKIFRDIHPKAPVHLLVVPKKHVRSIAHLKSGHKGIINAMIYAAKKVAAKQGLIGYKLVFNVGKEGGQIIDHLHLHLLGGWAKNDDKKVEV